MTRAQIEKSIRGNVAAASYYLAAGRKKNGLAAWLNQIAAAVSCLTLADRALDVLERK